MSDLELVMDAEIVDLTTDEAVRVTGRIRAWVNAYPIDEIKRAYFGRVWLAMDYESWSEWCDSELNGFKLPAVERREVVAELAGSGMSKKSISEVLDIGQATVHRDLTGSPHGDPDKVTGQDGKTYAKPKREQPVKDQPPRPSEGIVCERIPLSNALKTLLHRSLVSDLDLEEIEAVEVVLGRALKALARRKKELEQ